MTIEVLCNGVALTDPYVAVVRLKNSGRHAIASEQFDRQRALEIDLNVSIVELLSADAGQHGAVISACAVSGTTISFGPELIRKGQAITLTALVEGAPTLDVRDHFVDVQLKRAGVGGAPMAAFADRVATSTATAGAATALVAAITSLFS
ncbi:hypothetical protein [Streptomyces sp. NBC_00038]|uniref:hypothetical protein n=1 Tax=Streptomyces sp. NBC_00038 TaxID=2903615 RepID=UPI0022590287|nr:hypothetical protein [Streptomyces sp. NBC_00038]MCX5560728.1 hypothetical protein [Streptomyces sp. NBC_00038]